MRNISICTFKIQCQSNFIGKQVSMWSDQTVYFDFLENLEMFSWYTTDLAKTFLSCRHYHCFLFCVLRTCKQWYSPEQVKIWAAFTDHAICEGNKVNLSLNSWVSLPMIPQLKLSLKLLNHNYRVSQNIPCLTINI